MTEKYSYNDFVYVKNYEQNNHSPVIEHNVTKPDNLFKFYAMNKYSVDALTKGYLYASHPVELNDLLDSSPFLLFTSKKLEFEMYDNFFGFLYEDNKEDLVKFYREDSNRENLCKGYISKLWDTATNLFGIISMTTIENNTLMWPHYTQEKGFQLKFKTEELEQSIKSKINVNEGYLGLYPVNYTEKLSPIDIYSYQTMFVPLYYVTNVKSNKWNYENEWRFLISKQNMGVPYSKIGLVPTEDYFVNKENRYVYYDNKIIESITLGVNFFNGREFEIVWLDEKNIKVKPKNEKANWEYESQVLLLDFIVNNLKDHLFYSGIKYELDENGVHYIIRTKEKLQIEKQEDDSFILTRTNDVVKFN